MGMILEPVQEEQKSILRQLIELYEYDFTEYNGRDIGPLGLFGYRYLDHYWTEEGRNAYFIRCDGALAGFVLINRHCYVSKDPDTRFLAEFFVMRKYRRQGVGRKAARLAVLTHPGPWELTVHPANPNAFGFWSNVVEELSGGNYTLHENLQLEDDPDVAGYAAFTFSVDPCGR